MFITNHPVLFITSVIAAVYLLQAVRAAIVISALQPGYRLIRVLTCTLMLLCPPLHKKHFFTIIISYIWGMITGGIYKLAKDEHDFQPQGKSERKLTPIEYKILTEYAIPVVINPLEQLATTTDEFNLTFITLIRFLSSDGVNDPTGYVSSVENTWKQWVDYNGYDLKISDLVEVLEKFLLDPTMILEGKEEL